MSGNGHLPRIHHIMPSKQSMADSINARRQADAGRSPAADRFDQILRNAQRPDRPESTDRQIRDSQARAADRRKLPSKQDDPPGLTVVDRDRPRADLDRPDGGADTSETERTGAEKPAESTDERSTGNNSRTGTDTDAAADTGNDAAADNDAVGESAESQQQDDGEHDVELADASKPAGQSGDGVPVDLQPLSVEASVEDVPLERVREVEVGRVEVGRDGVEETLVDSEQSLEVNVEIPVDQAPGSVDEPVAATAEVAETGNASEGEELPRNEAPADETVDLTNPLAAVAAVQARLPIESNDTAGPADQVDDASPLTAFQTLSAETSTDAGLADNHADTGSFAGTDNDGDVGTDADVGIDAELGIEADVGVDAGIGMEADVDLVEADSAQPTGDAARATEPGTVEEASVPTPLTTSPTVSTTATPTAATTTSALGQVSPIEVIEPRVDGSQLAPAAEAEDSDQLWHQVRRAIGSLRTTTAGDQQMTIRLSPAELGSVVVRVSTGELGTSVTLVTESAAAANQLNQQRQQLISDLEDTGIGGVDVEIDTSTDANQSQNQDGEDGDDRNGSGRSAVGGPTMADSDLVRNYGNRRDRATTSRLVDLDL